MKAKPIPRIDIHDRIELKNQLPLRTPYVINIDPCDTCNFRCKKSLEIIDAGLDRINISIEGVTAEQYLEFSNCIVVKNVGK